MAEPKLEVDKLEDPARPLPMMVKLRVWTDLDKGFEKRGLIIQFNPENLLLVGEGEQYPVLNLGEMGLWKSEQP